MGVNMGFRSTLGALLVCAATGATATNGMNRIAGGARASGRGGADVALDRDCRDRGPESSPI